MSPTEMATALMDEVSLETEAKWAEDHPNLPPHLRRIAFAAFREGVAAGMTEMHLAYSRRIGPEYETALLEMLGADQ